MPDDDAPPGTSHVLRQAGYGEFDPPDEDRADARRMTAHEFAAARGVPVAGTHQHRVTWGSHDYYWSKETGKFDGWGRRLS